MQMQVIVSACFSLYTYESNLSAPQTAISLTQQTATSTTTRSPFHHQSNAISLNKRPLQPSNVHKPSNIRNTIYLLTDAK